MAAMLQRPCQLQIGPLYHVRQSWVSTKVVCPFLLFFCTGEGRVLPLLMFPQQHDLLLLSSSLSPHCPFEMLALKGPLAYAYFQLQVYMLTAMCNHTLSALSVLCPPS